MIEYCWLDVKRLVFFKVIGKCFGNFDVYFFIYREIIFGYFILGNDFIY